MAIVTRPSRDDIERELWTYIRSNLGIDPDPDSSAIGVLVRMLSAQLDGLWGLVENAARQSNITTATGTGLDNFGALIGVPRRPAREATTIGRERAVQFTNLGASTVNILAGTRVFPEGSPDKSFLTTENLVLEAGSTGSVHVKAEKPGTAFNVVRGEINAHNAPYSGLLVTNIAPIDNGSFAESDASYRERLVREFQRRSNTNVDNVVALIRSIPGVRDVIVNEFARGPGTFDVIVIPYNVLQTSTVVSEAQLLLERAVAAGISARAMGPIYRQLDVVVNLIFKNDSTVPRDAVRARVRSMIVNLIDSLDVEDGNGSGTFYPEELKASIISMDNVIAGATLRMSIDGTPIRDVGVFDDLGRGERIILRSVEVT